MPVSQKIFALLICCFVFVVTVNLVRKRKLREEYSVLWLLTSLLMFVLVLRYEWLVALTGFIGAGLPTTTLFICSIIFLILIAVQFSIKISKLTEQVKDLAQENALLRSDVEHLMRQAPEEQNYGSRKSGS
ncbi:DUF2304 domain-containing protein [Pelotalea chapellei]|uniref:DUF2304 family protein n=1 Tax=Pelotalea chapellei TaxID=44671 RepID=A0ABS5UA80_9BACT|nr:DUF2304 domain-containing protein [Pelotalea chapellei]MBT1072575.1 DUF2304 family protein [Pelotalea chapellei]